MIKNIKSILYASDLHGVSGKLAFHSAVAEGIMHKAKIIFLHVIEPLNPMLERAVEVYMTEENREYISADINKLIHDDISERINSFLIEELPPESPPLEIEIKIMSGPPSNIILEVAENHKVDMIIMGTRTNNKLEQVFLGSTAHEVIFHSKCPVLVVPLKNLDSH